MAKALPGHSPFVPLPTIGLHLCGPDVLHMPSCKVFLSFFLFYIQVTPTTSTNNHHDNPRPRTRMAPTYVQGLEMHPHPTQENNTTINHKQQRQLKDRRLTNHDTDPNREGTREEQQAVEAGIGGGKELGGSGLQRSRGLRPPHGRTHSTTRLEKVL